jgi:SAM-dependent methyltransferase
VPVLENFNLRRDSLFKQIADNVRTPFVRPDRDAALRQYRSRAAIYDTELIFARPIRRRCVAKLSLAPGDTVVDAGCGTGLSFSLIERAIGQNGRLIGIEQSADMLAQAKNRVRSGGWANADLICSPVEDANFEARADAILFHFTHDILRTPAAVANVMAHAKSGARVVAAGLKWAPSWALPVNLGVLFGALRSTTALEGLDRPWSTLEKYLTRIEIEEFFAGGVYLATGIVG